MNILQYGLDVSLKFLHVVHPFNQVSLAIQDKDRRKLFHVIQRRGLRVNRLWIRTQVQGKLEAAFFQKWTSLSKEIW